MKCLSTSFKSCFINSLPRKGITSMFIQLLVNKSTIDLLRTGNCAGTNMEIMVRQTVCVLSCEDERNEQHSNS